MQRIDLEWAVGPTEGEGAPPATRVPATVPGAVQLDWARAQGWGPHWYADNFRQYDGLEDRAWSYLATPDVPTLPAGQRLYFVTRGVDYRFAIRVGGRVIHEQEGMFTPVELDVTDDLRPGAAIEVLIAPAPKSTTTPDRNQANQSCKPAVSYGWDFHPRLIPLGICDETFLEVRPARHIAGLSTDYDLAADHGDVVVLPVVSLAGRGACRVRWTLLDPSGDVAAQDEMEAAEDAEAVVFNATVERPRLWWPHDQGEPALYTCVAELLDGGGGAVQRVEKRVGFRRVRLVMNEGAWGQPLGYPKSRSVPPITLEINGRPIFGKGANWVAPDIFVGTLTRDRYREQLRLVRDAHMNLLRCWGGAAVMKEAFFELCDELGIMVWQEFPLACNRYEGTPEYLEVLDAESRSIITRLREHPSLVLWCGGNELFNSWSKMTDQDAALRLLNRNTYDLDPDRPFLMTSPVMGMGHGHYVFRDPRNGEEAWAMFQRGAFTAYTEFGLAAPSPVEVLRKFIPADELFPPRQGTAWETHHAFGVWMPMSWLNLPVIEHYFGEAQTLEELVERGQFIQAEGYRGLFEEARRQKPQASMALNWAFNEPWPCAANNSLVAWPCEPKPALHAVGQACRPVLASGRVRKMLWNQGELFDPELWLLSDCPAPVEAGRLTASVRVGGREIPLLTWDFPALEPNRNLRGPRAQLTLPDLEGEWLELLLRVEGRPELDSTYRFPYRATVRPKARAGAATMNM